MENWDINEIMGFHIRDFFPPAECMAIESAFNKVKKTGNYLWYVHTIRSSCYLWLIDQIDDGIIAVHEVHDNPDDRPRLKKFLLAASGNFHKKYFKKNVG